MRISAKLSEIGKTDILLHTANPYIVHEILKSKEGIESATVTRCRKSPCPQGRNPEEYSEFCDLHQHKVNIILKTSVLPISIKISSWRINAEEVAKMGLTPDPVANSKEKTARMMRKLGDNDERLY